MQPEQRDIGSDVVETPMADLLEALADRLEAQTAASLESLRRQAEQLRDETAASVASLRRQAALLRDARDFATGTGPQRGTGHA